MLVNSHHGILLKQKALTLVRLWVSWYQDWFENDFTTSVVLTSLLVWHFIQLDVTVWFSWVSHGHMIIEYLRVRLLLLCCLPFLSQFGQNIFTITLFQQPAKGKWLWQKKQQHLVLFVICSIRKTFFILATNNTPPAVRHLRWKCCVMLDSNS